MVCCDSFQEEGKARSERHYRINQTLIFCLVINEE
jgi:hypothetical protein